MREREDYWFELRIKKSFEGRNDIPLKDQGKCKRERERERRADGNSLEFEQAGDGWRERVREEFRDRLWRGRREKFKGCGSFEPGLWM